MKKKERMLKAKTLAKNKFYEKIIKWKNANEVIMKRR